MNYKNLFCIPLLAIAVMCSCSDDNEFGSRSSEYVNSVRVTVEDFLSESPYTRTAYTVDGSGFHFQWIDGDALGIYPVGGDQVKFPISNGDGSASASFDGGAWKLRSEYRYAAYYPFSVDNYKKAITEIPVTYTTQIQDGNASTAHLGARDYLACAATSPDGSGGVDLLMKHLGAFVRFQLTMPKADTFSAVELQTNTDGFVLSGKVDLSAEVPTITPVGTTDRYTISLKNISTIEKNQMITVYAMFAPTNLSGRDIKITVYGKGQTTYVQTVSGRNFEARKAYNFAIDNFPSGTNASGEDVSWEEPEDQYNGHEFVDLGLSVKWATMNIGATAQEDYGDYYAWGETEPYYTEGHSHDNPCSDWKAGKTGYNWASYKWCNGSYDAITKYCFDSTRGTVDGQTTLELTDDAARMNWGGSWRMPTMAELDELYNYNNCSITETTQNNVKGYKVTSKKNGNFIFIPCAGIRNFSEIVFLDRGGYLWSSSLSTRYTDCACNFAFADNTVWLESSRYSGRSIRAVCP